MKIKKNHLIGFILLLFFSCSQESSISNNDNVLGNIESEVDEHFISTRVALSIAEIVEFPSETANILSKSANIREIETTVPIGDPQKPNYYIINYKYDRGFLIISADDRVEPILAYSDTGRFVVNIETPEGIYEWMSNTETMINGLRENNENVLRSVSNTRSEYILDPDHPNYNPCAIQHIIGPNPQLCGVYDPCKRQYYGVDPLVVTKWDQWGGFNDKLGRDKTCVVDPWYNPTGNPPTGCVATAAAQIMRYHKYSGNKKYNWDSMSNGYGGGDTPYLMADLGRALGSTYKCEGTGASTKNIVSVLKSTYGYSSATFGKIDYRILTNNLSAKRPVILRGSKKKNADGHAWVCSGYSETYDPCGGTSTWYYMNWGWSGKSDGWFLSSYLGYDYENEMVYDIKP